LHLPQRVGDLSAVRAGDKVTLTWTDPRRDTDKIAIAGNVTAAVCRKEAAHTACVAAGEVSAAPGAKGQFVDSLAAELAAGAPRALTYFVELKNKHGRSAGESNEAVVLAGEAPAVVTGFAAELHRDGVAVRWAAGDGSQAVRLYRTLLTAPVKKKDAGSHAGILSAPKEQLEQKLLVDSDGGRALDKSVNYGESYEYRAQRVARVTVDGQTIELPGEISAAVRVDVEDVFPPVVPTGLAAVATPASSAAAAAIDLNWLPVTDRNLAGYVVYRREGDGTWVRVSPEKPVAGPAFHDAAVQAGHAYRYAVSAVSLTGHESRRSDEAEESVPSN
jgi:hypothetical protein